jgi:hypothetical protein
MVLAFRLSVLRGRRLVLSTGMLGGENQFVCSSLAPLHVRFGPSLLLRVGLPLVTMVRSHVQSLSLSRLLEVSPCRIHG